MADEVRIDFTGGRRMIQAMERDSGPFRRMYKQWAAMYSTEMRRRFMRQGDGEWPPLKQSTKKARRRGGGSAKILRDTGSLFKALSIGGPGNHTKPIKNGIRFGFGGSTHSGGVTFKRLAMIHQLGKGNVPRREILVHPDRYPILVTRMLHAAGRAFKGPF